MNNGFDYDLAVIGAGTAGLVAALEGAKSGARVALIEKAKPGGRKLWGGGVALPVLTRSARLMADVARSEEFGVHIESSRLVWGAIRMRVAAVRDEIRDLQRQRIKEAGINLVTGTARFVDSHTLAIQTAEGETRLQAAAIILAAGTSERIPAIPGLEDCGFLLPAALPDLPTLPRSLAIIGGGSDACELAQVLARFGRTITLLEAGPRLLPGADIELSEAAQKILRQEGVRVYCDVRFQSAERGEKNRLNFSDEIGQQSNVEASQIIVAAGREARLSGLCLEVAGIRWDEDGLFADDYLSAGAKHLYACGSVVCRLAPPQAAAEYQGRLAAQNALSTVRKKADYRAVPTLALLDPEIASVGLTEAEAAAEGGYRIYRAEYKDLDRAIMDGETEGFVKLIVSPAGRLLGAHIAGARAGELIQNYVPALLEGALIQELATSLHAFPSFCEAGLRAVRAAGIAGNG